MSEPTAEKALLDALDRTLREVNAADAQHREAKREEQRAMSVLSGLGADAQRLRLALWALKGDYDKNPGDANAANNDRRQELRREATS